MFDGNGVGVCMSTCARTKHRKQKTPYQLKKLIESSWKLAKHHNCFAKHHNCLAPLSDYDVLLFFRFARADSSNPEAQSQQESKALNKLLGLSCVAQPHREMFQKTLGEDWWEMQTI